MNAARFFLKCDDRDAFSLFSLQISIICGNKYGRS